MRRAATHQGLMLGTLALYVATAIQLWPRIIVLFRG